MHSRVINSIKVTMVVDTVTRSFSSGRMRQRSTSQMSAVLGFDLTTLGVGVRGGEARQQMQRT